MKNIKIKKQNFIGLKGIYKFTKAKILTSAQWRLHDKIEMLRNKGEYIGDLIKELNKICKVEKWEFENLIVTVGRTMLANNLTNTSPDNVMLVTHVALGTDDTVPVNGDTTLTTETYRNAVASKTNANNIGYISGFFTATEVTGTFKEAGVFSDASGAADSGILVSHVNLKLPNGVIKTATDTLTIDFVITFS